MTNETPTTEPAETPPAPATVPVKTFGALDWHRFHARFELHEEWPALVAAAQRRNMSVNDTIREAVAALVKLDRLEARR